MDINTIRRATSLGTLGRVVDLAHQYAPGSYQVDCAFEMHGLRFRAQRFVRTDAGGACDVVHLFIAPPAGSGADGFDGDEFLRAIDRRRPNAVDQRALNLLAVAEVPAGDAAERFALLEAA
jgi:hypothetical protein